MPTPQQIETAIRNVQDQTSFIKLLLKDTLNWQIPDGIENIEDMAFTWTSDELRADGLDAKVVDGKVLQIQPLEQNQQWGIFLLEFKNDDAFVKGRGLTGPLRKVLRGLVRKKRQQANRPAWDRENLLFICTHKYEHYCFAYFKSPKDTKLAPLSTFGWAKGDTAIHTLCEYNLSNLVWSDDPQQPQWRTAFDLEKVTKGFFSHIAILFTQLVGGKRKVGSRTRDFGEGSLGFPSLDDTDRKEFAVRLIGRLVFCWFLKKKRSKQDVTLLPEELLSTQALNNNKEYYHNVLEPLFFEVLNTPMDARVKRFTQKLWATIPFLNGGLFTPHDDDYYPNHVQQRAQFLNMLSVPDDWLRGLLNIFESYNFTIDENTPVDVELAIEPEMLGRIFENLLAEINPETGETARKATGSYYTPRPIVEYMVDESLKQYLLTKTELSEERISALLSYAQEDLDLTDAQKDKVLDALDTVKVIDPACGSGAFPMGILQKVLLILGKIDPDSKKWLGRILSRIDDITFKKNLERKLKRESLEYVHKLGVIRDAIYGVDIQPIAVEISKLRCFLSLIVDETIDDTQPNRGVEPLPNLEFKFVCANTLIGLHGDMLPTNQALRKIDELKQVRQEYLNTYGKEKKDLENKFLTIRSELSRLALDWQEGSEKALKLSDWNPFSDEPCSWFDPEWMFGIKNGFDIAIGNPPYLESRSPQFSGDMKDALKEAFGYRWPGYPPLPRGSDLLVYFLELSVSIVSELGHVVLITQNSWLDTEYGKKLQSFLLKNTEVKAIIDSDYKYFDSKSGPNVNTVIVVFTGRRPSTEGKVRFIRCHETFEQQPVSVANIEESFRSDKVDCYVYPGGDKNLDNVKWGILLAADSCVLEVIDALQDKGKLYNQIGDIEVNIGQGLNLSSEHFASSNLISEFAFLKECLIPIMTNVDGAVFELTSTGQSLVDGSKLNSKQKQVLAKNGVKTFDPHSTSKQRPVLILPRGVSRHFCALNSIAAFSSSYVDVYAESGRRTEEVIWNFWLFLNSSILWLLREIGGRKNLGGGLLKAEAIDLKSFPVYLDFGVTDKIKSIFSRLRTREAMPTLAEIETPEHKEIDRIVFDHLELNRPQRDTIHRTLSERITGRATKSKT